MNLKTTLSQKLFIPLSLFLILSLVTLDQLIKYKIRSNGGFYICNPGISFNVPLPFFAFWLIFGLFFIITGLYFSYLYKKGIVLAIITIGMSLLVGGALSNAIDRAFFGCVFDYIFPFWQYVPLFNVADIAIFLGTCLLILSYFKKRTI